MYIDHEHRLALKGINHLEKINLCTARMYQIIFKQLTWPTRANIYGVKRKTLQNINPSFINQSQN